MKEYCDKLRDARKKKEILMHDLADMLGVSRQTVCNWEGGHTIPPRNRQQELTTLLECDLMVKYV